MNREAAVLGTPVWSMFEGPLGGVDELLVREGRLQAAHRPRGDRVRAASRRAALDDRVRRDPADLLQLALPGV